MTHVHRALLLPVLLLVLLAAACGGDDEITVPGDAVAVVGDQTIPKTEFDALIAQAKKSYESQEREFPKAGTPEYETLKNQAIQFLVQRAQFEQKAEELEVEVTDAQVDERLKQIKEQYFGGDEKKYAEQLEEQGLSDEQVKKDIRAQLVQEAIFNKVTEDIEVTDAEVTEFYNKNKEQYSQPESRDVRHILVTTKAEADKLYAQLQNGGNFEKLAKEHSKDPGSAAQGGKLTIARGQTVEPFDQTAFLLAKGTLSKPVKTQYGFHLIEPVGDIQPAKTTPLAEVKESIKQQLLQTKRNEAMTKWVEEIKAEFEKRTAYQVGYAPPATTAETETDGEPGEDAPTDDAPAGTAPTETDQ
jgi:parvulin-like peptidyl-prolyl isomerase